MAQIGFCFQGYVRGAEVERVTVSETGESLDVSDFSAEEIIEKLQSGEWCISLGDFLYANRKDSEIEAHDFDPSCDSSP
jgi:hypothetical protein